MSGFALRIGHFCSVPWIPNYVEAEKWMASLVNCESSGVRHLATSGAVDITPMSVVDWFELEGSWQRLGDWGISFRERAGSVCFFSQQPIETLDRAEIAICTETTTSVRVLHALLQEKYKLRIGSWQRHVDLNDSATPRLLIQNKAVEELARKRFQFVYDLGAEWFEWQGTPVIPAVWVHKASVSPEQTAQLRQRLVDAMVLYRKDPEAAIAEHRAKYKWAASIKDICALHRNFEYELEGELFKRGLERMRAVLPARIEALPAA